jgi:O-antigen ligase
LVGLLSGKNTAGAFCMVAVLVWASAALWSQNFWERSLLWVGAALWFVFLIGTNSQTSIASTVLALTFAIIIRHMIERPLIGIIISLTMVFVSLLVLFVFNLLGGSFSDVVGVLEFQRTTLTGRAVVWQITYEAFLQNKLLGTGYGSLWSAGTLTPAEIYADVPLTKFLIGINQAHNGYIDILATLGIVGAVAFLGFLISVAVVNVRALANINEGQVDPAFVVLCNCVFLAMVMHNVTESSFLRGGMLWSLFVLCYLSLCSVSWRRSQSIS